MTEDFHFIVQLKSEGPKIEITKKSSRHIKRSITRITRVIGRKINSIFCHL